MWFTALFSGKNGTMFRNIIYIGLIVTFLVILTIVIVAKNKKNKTDAAGQAIVQQYEAEILPDKLSYTESEYESMASTIDNAIGFWTDDDETITTVFMKMKTNSDVLKLQETFGVRSAGHDLFTAIHRNLNSEEIQRINTVLSQRNISIKI